MANDQRPDPFGEPHLIATLPQARPMIGVALFIAIAVLLLAARNAGLSMIRKSGYRFYDEIMLKQ